MIYVFEGGSVVYNGSTLTEEQKASAVAVDELPEPDKIEGKVPVLRANLKTQEVYYEYVDEPKNDEVEELKDHIANIYELILFGEGNE